MKGLKKVLSYGLALALSISLVGCSSTDKTKEESKSEPVSKLEQIKENGKLVLGTSGGYAPYEFHKMIDGKDTLTGFDIMLGEEIAKELGVKLELVDMDFDGLLGALNANKVDMVLACMTPNPERVKNADFTDLYYVDSNVVIVKKGNEDKIKTDDDLKNIKVGVQRGTTQEAFITKTLKCANVTALPKIPDLMLELQNGRIDAIVTGKNVAAINVKQYEGTAIGNSTVGKGLEESAAVAFKKSDDKVDNKELIDLINKKIKELKDSGKADEMMQNALKLADGK
ncbi:transporter substrate-binding domain-containing protein [Romboutsia sp.]|uniref:transporter substrate-binding domain-containing protein n=1 Tax=Romboutsia sp. TaxID=1965302 RepID=UPI003F35E2EE